jgi:hypothetical protein
MRYGTVKALRVGGGTDASWATDIAKELLQACLTSRRPALVIEALFEDDVRFALELISDGANRGRIRVGVVTNNAGDTTEFSSGHPLAFFRPDQMGALMSWLEQ